jgi:hypothetical protein
MASSVALGDWDPEDPYKMHFPQLPDPIGWDVHFDQGLADDWECTETGPVSDIHFWCSFMGDDVVAIPSVFVAIYSDDPVGPGYSQPAQELWSRTFDTGEFTFRHYGEGDQGFLLHLWDQPPAVWPHDHINFYQINITEISDPFEQEEGLIYWLYIYIDPLIAVGWKTSLDHFNDAAVWWDGISGEWFPMEDPETGEQLDLAFVITNTELDFGDAPDPNYPTLLASDGARHVIDGPYFCDSAGGDAPDPEADGQPHPWATGDDTDGNDDEDGVTIPPLTVGVSTNISVDVCGGGGVVQIWIDYNGDEDWDDAGEQVHNAWLNDGPHSIPVTAPAGSVQGLTVMRCRISTAGGLLPTGQAADGEVEDHRVSILAVGPGNDCTDPVLVTLSLAALPYTDTNTTCGRGDDYNDTCLAEYDNGEDIIYEVNVTEAMDVNVTLDPCGTTYTGIAIDDTCPPGSSCMRHSINNEATPHGFCLHLEPGTYYIMVDKFSWPTCIPEFTLTIDQGGPEPANDDCDNAQPVGDVVDLPFDTRCATTDGDGKCRIGANIWYCYTATCTGDVTVSLCGSSFDTMLAVYNGCSCHPTGAMIGCNDDFDCPTGDGLQSQITFAAFAGHDYLIEVGGYHADGGQGLLNIRCDEEPDVKWLQRPDLTSNGMDIRISDDGGGGHRVADDFECNQPGLLTHVRLWCSWKDDEVDEIYDFTLTIREDIPAGVQNPHDSNIYDYSMPGKVLWSREFLGGAFAFEPKEFEMSLYADLWPEYEWFWDPFWARDPCERGDQQVWQVDFDIDPRVAFRQRGTQENPVIYWLEANAQTSMSSNKRLGWKTSTDHWNDDGVWWDWRIYPIPRIYRELRYPPGHPNEPNSMDMAFMISTTAEANEPNGPVKWLQRPDETPNGMDIRCDRSDQVPRWLADDFSCTTTGPITDIHLWCSWRDDFIGEVEMFHLSIHEDLPPYDPCNPYTYSMPGEELWSRDFYSGEFDETLYLDLDPNYEYWFDPYRYFDDPCGDQQIWQYDFFIDEHEAFTQEGDPCEPKIYWLDVYVLLDQSFPGTEFGWKTSIDHWNDCAVYWDPDWSNWSMLWYPDGHPLHGSQVDMAFSITQPEVSDDLDFGDAPDPCYPTLLASDGARHIIGGPYFCDAIGGDAPDPEGDGQPHPWATGDDTDGNDDEDGVNFPVLVQGQPDTVFLDICGGGGIVELWIDYNGDQDWDDAGELEFSGWMGDGPGAIVVNPPAGSVIGQTFARCRISTAGTNAPTGQADDGEVEDHMVQIEEVDCLSTIAPEYAAWVSLGKPLCWCYRRQCRGDIDGIQTGPFHVAIPDLTLFKQCFNQFVLPPGCECADLDHLQTGPFRVAIPDLTIFKTYFNQFVVPQCDQIPIYTGPYNFWTN